MGVLDKLKETVLGAEREEKIPLPPEPVSTEKPKKEKEKPKKEEAKPFVPTGNIKDIKKKTKQMEENLVNLKRQIELKNELLEDAKEKFDELDKIEEQFDDLRENTVDKKSLQRFEKSIKDIESRINSAKKETRTEGLDQLSERIARLEKSVDSIKLSGKEQLESNLTKSADVQSLIERIERLEKSPKPEISEEFRKFKETKSKSELEVNKLFADVKNMSDVIKDIESQNSIISTLMEKFKEKLDAVAKEAESAKEKAKQSDILTQEMDKIRNDVQSLSSQIIKMRDSAKMFEQEFVMREYKNWEQLKNTVKELAKNVSRYESKVIDMELAFHDMGDVKKEVMEIKRDTNVLHTLRLEMDALNKSLTSSEQEMINAKNLLNKKSSAIEKRIDSMEGLFFNQRYQVSQKVYSLLIFNSLAHLNNATDQYKLISELMTLEAVFENAVKNGFWDETFTGQINTFFDSLVSNWEAENDMQMVANIKEVRERIEKLLGESL